MVTLNPILQQREFDYSDILVLPGYSDFDMNDINLTARLTRKIKLNLPFVSSPMDTVTEHKLAIALAREGGIGIIHYNLTPEEQAAEVEKVKLYIPGFVRNPVTLDSNSRIDEYYKLKEDSGFDTFPITLHGKRDGKLVGLITPRYFDKSQYQDKIREYMIPLDKLVYGKLPRPKNPEDIMEDAKRMMRENPSVDMLPYVNSKGGLIGIVTKEDIEEATKYPNAVKDKNGRLLVGAAIKTKNYHEGLERLVKAGVDAVVIDTSDGHGKFMRKMIKEIKEECKDLQLIVGNVVTGEATKFLIESGADAIRVGVGPSPACETQQTIGVGRRQAKAVYECALAAKEYAEENKAEPVPVLADGGIKFSGDILKALALGANTVMIGYLFAGTKESAAPFAKNEATGEEDKGFKVYRGMGSKEAMERGSAIRYNLENVQAQERVPEGKVMKVKFIGSVSDLVRGNLAPGLRQGMIKAGGRTIQELHEKASIIESRFM